jgi:ubiquitin-protein ligase
MQYPVKYIIPSNYPMAPPKVYFDFQLSMDIVKAVDYIGQQNVLNFQYLQMWNPQFCSLTNMTQQLFQLVQSKPPVSPAQAQPANPYGQPQQAQPSQAWGG